MASIKDRILKTLGAATKAADTPDIKADKAPPAPSVELEAKLQTARAVLEIAQTAAGAAALAAEEEGTPGADKRLDQARAELKAAGEHVDRLEGAIRAAQERTSEAQETARRKGRARLVAQRTAVLEALHTAAAEALKAEDDYVTARVALQRIVDESLPLLPEGSRQAILDSNNYVLPALFKKLHAARLPYAGMKILLLPGTPLWRDRLPGLDHAEAK